MKGKANPTPPLCSPKGARPWLDVPPCYSTATTSPVGLRGVSIIPEHRFLDLGLSFCNCAPSTGWPSSSCWHHWALLHKERCSCGTSIPQPGVPLALITVPCCSPRAPAVLEASPPAAPAVCMGPDSSLVHVEGLCPCSLGSGTAHPLVRGGDERPQLQQQSQHSSG